MFEKNTGKSIVRIRQVIHTAIKGGGAMKWRNTL